MAYFRLGGGGETGTFAFPRNFFPFFFCVFIYDYIIMCIQQYNIISYGFFSYQYRNSIELMLGM